MNFKAVLIFAALAAVALPFAAHAQSASTTFDVTITIDSTCSIDTPAATDVDFGNVDLNGTANLQITSKGDLTRPGTNAEYHLVGTDYEIALDSGVNGTTVADRAMSNGTTLVPYQLFRDPARTLVWGTTLEVDTFGGTGTGAVQEVPVYGLVPSANFPADTVTY